jgi:hypothetical protein
MAVTVQRWTPPDPIVWADYEDVHMEIDAPTAIFEGLKPGDLVRVGRVFGATRVLCGRVVDVLERVDSHKDHARLRLSFAAADQDKDLVVSAFDLETRP